MILSAERCAPRFGAPKTSRLNPASASGVRYERRVGKALTVLSIDNGLLLESQPWFSYLTWEPEYKYCAPDFILSPLDYSWILVVDAKQTFYQAAMEKLTDLYIPLVRATYNRPTKGVLICKTLIPGAPRPVQSLRECRDFESSIYHWPEIGPSILW